MYPPQGGDPFCDRTGGEGEGVIASERSDRGQLHTCLRTSKLPACAFFGRQNTSPLRPSGLHSDQVRRRVRSTPSYFYSTGGIYRNSTPDFERLEARQPHEGPHLRLPSELTGARKPQREKWEKLEKLEIAGQRCIPRASSYSAAHAVLSGILMVGGGVAESAGGHATPNFMIPLNHHQPAHSTTPFLPPPINTTSPPTAVFKTPFNVPLSLSAVPATLQQACHTRVSPSSRPPKWKNTKVATLAMSQLVIRCTISLHF